MQLAELLAEVPHRVPRRQGGKFFTARHSYRMPKGEAESLNETATSKESITKEKFINTQRQTYKILIEKDTNPNRKISWIDGTKAYHISYISCAI